MKKIYFLFIMIPSCLIGNYCDRFTTELRVGGFFPFSPTFQEIYGDCGVEYEIEGSAMVYDNVAFWINANYFQKNGSSIGLGDHTKVQLYPISTGFKFILPLTECLDVYVGVGGSYTFATFRDDSPFVQNPVHKYAWGTVVKSGMTYLLTSNFFVDAFADYYFTSVSTPSSHVSIGGIRTGLGLGISY